MSSPIEERINDISTMWTVLRDAHAGDAAVANAAQALLIERYGPPTRRYLLKLTGSQQTAEELFQEFALQLIRGDFRNVEPDRGRFRSYLKSVLVRAAARHRAQSQTRNLASVECAPEAAEANQEFDLQWRTHLLERTWSALRDARPIYERALRLRIECPDDSSTQLAQRFSELEGNSYSAESFRQLLHRARKRFAELLIHEIIHTLQAPTREHIEDELSSLNLLSYCREALDDRQG